jgi:hypothetical protein
MNAPLISPVSEYGTAVSTRNWELPFNPKRTELVILLAIAIRVIELPVMARLIVSPLSNGRIGKVALNIVTLVIRGNWLAVACNNVRGNPNINTKNATNNLMLFRMV